MVVSAVRLEMPTGTVPLKRLLRRDLRPRETGPHCAAEANKGASASRNTRTKTACDAALSKVCRKKGHTSRRRRAARIKAESAAYM